MRILRVRSALQGEGLKGALEMLDAVAVRPDAVQSVEEFSLAHHLAKRAFEKKANIARSLRVEFLLWLSGKTDIRSAVLETAPEERGGGEQDFFIVVFSDAGDARACTELSAKVRPLGLKKDGEPLALERISLSRVKN